MTPHDILGLEPGVTDPTAIRRAYALKLRDHRPDADPAGFTRIRAAKDALLGRGGALGGRNGDGASGESRTSHLRDEARPADPCEPAGLPSVTSEVVPEPLLGSRAVREARATLHAISEAIRVRDDDKAISLGVILADNPMLLSLPGSASITLALAEFVAIVEPHLADRLTATAWSGVSPGDRDSYDFDGAVRRRTGLPVDGPTPRPIRRLVNRIVRRDPVADIARDAASQPLKRALAGLALYSDLSSWIVSHAPHLAWSRRTLHFRRREEARSVSTQAARHRAARWSDRLLFAAVAGFVVIVIAAWTWSHRSPVPPAARTRRVEVEAPFRRPAGSRPNVEGVRSASPPRPTAPVGR